MDFVFAKGTEHQAKLGYRRKFLPFESARQARLPDIPCKVGETTPIQSQNQGLKRAIDAYSIIQTTGPRPKVLLVNNGNAT